MLILNNTLSLPFILMTLSLCCFSTAHISAAESDNDNPVTMESMKNECRDLMSRHQIMEAYTKNQDELLTRQVTAMNKAAKDQKLTLIAETLTMIAEQRSTRDAQQDKMRGEMMKHMAKHMKMGPDSTSACPMCSTDTKDKKMMEMKAPSKIPTLKEE